MSAPRARLAKGTARDLPPIRRDQIRIAVAEDDAELRAVLAETLRERGLEVVEAIDGATLLAAIRRGGITLAVTDHFMPGLAGGDVLGLCRITGEHMPFIVVTGAPHEISDALADLPDVLMLRKPFTPDELLVAVASALGLAMTPH